MQNNLKTYISILRGINVSGHHIIKMEDLRQLFAKIGMQNIQTYIQSGNIVFQHIPTDKKILETQISNAITEKFNFNIPVIVLEFAEMAQIISKNPFLSYVSKDVCHLHVTFLSENPCQENYNKITAGIYQNDEFALVDKAIYLYCPNGYGNSKLSNSFFENKLKVTATTRNWKTTLQLNQMANLNINLTQLKKG